MDLGPILLVLGAALVALLVLVAGRLVDRQHPALEPEPEPVPMPEPVPEPRPDPVPAKRVTVRLVSAKGRKLKELTIDSRQRKPKLTYELKPGQVSEFVADRKTPEGVWIYRRIHVERQG